MQMPVFIILFLAPVYVPLDLLAGWVQAVAQVNPFTALIEGGRDLISGQRLPAAAGVRGRAAALGAVFLAWAVRGVRFGGDAPVSRSSPSGASRSGPSAS